MKNTKPISGLKCTWCGLPSFPGKVNGSECGRVREGMTLLCKGTILPDAEVEREDSALKMAHDQSNKDYLESGSFSASTFGLDGIPHVRFRAIARLMIKFSMHENASLQQHLADMEIQVKQKNEALKDLINLKGHKEICGKDDHYIKWQPIVWDNAAKALNENTE